MAATARWETEERRGANWPDEHGRNEGNGRREENTVRKVRPRCLEIRQEKF